MKLFALVATLSCAASPIQKPSAALTAAIEKAKQDAESPLPPPRCKTTCGLVADVNEASCLALNAMETRVLYHYAKEVPEFNPGWVSCSHLAGWRVFLHKFEKSDAFCGNGAWLLRPKVCVLGVTRGHDKTMELGDEGWSFNAFAHEVGHILDHGYGTGKGPEHCGWSSRGLSLAICEAAFDCDTFPEACPKEPKGP